MHKSISVAFVLIYVASFTARSQYYYKDIVSNKQVLSERSVLKEQKIRNILVHSFEGNKEPSAGFFCEKKISKDYRKVETYTKSNLTGKSLLTAQYNNQDQLVQSTDSSELSVTNSYYTYNDKGSVQSIVSYSHSSDEDFSTSLVEEHVYIYDGGDKPVKMIRTRNKKDTASIIFTKDERGNIVDENDLGKNGKHYYYYYNEKNRLTDVVKYNGQQRKLLPEFLFEYNTAGQVTQMVTVEEGMSNDYYTWKYVYNDGLRIIEKCFSKENILLGYFEYEYN